VEVRVEEELLMNTTKKAFLLNIANKQHFINILADKLQKQGIDVTKCSADADYDIVKVALEYAVISNTVVIGEDTDLLVLLSHYYRSTGNSVHLESESRKKQSQLIYSNYSRNLEKTYARTYYSYMHSSVATQFQNQVVLVKRFHLYSLRSQSAFVNLWL